MSSFRSTMREGDHLAELTHLSCYMSRKRLVDADVCSSQVYGAYCSPLKQHCSAQFSHEDVIPPRNILKFTPSNTPQNIALEITSQINPVQNKLGPSIPVNGIVGICTPNSQRTLECIDFPDFDFGNVTDPISPSKYLPGSNISQPHQPSTASHPIKPNTNRKTNMFSSESYLSRLGTYNSSETQPTNDKSTDNSTSLNSGVSPSKLHSTGNCSPIKSYTTSPLTSENEPANASKPSCSILSAPSNQPNTPKSLGPSSCNPSIPSSFPDNPPSSSNQIPEFIFDEDLEAIFASDVYIPCTPATQATQATQPSQLTQSTTSARVPPTNPTTDTDAPTAMTAIHSQGELTTLKLYAAKLQTENEMLLRRLEAEEKRSEAQEDALHDVNRENQALKEELEKIRNQARFAFDTSPWSDSDKEDECVGEEASEVRDKINSLQKNLVATFEDLNNQRSILEGLKKLHAPKV